MFVGHYGPSFAVKALRPTIPLWLLFVAVQLVDVAWAVLVLLGVEKVRIVPGITASNPLDLYYMPYTHGLIAAILWSVAAAVLVWISGVRSLKLRFSSRRATQSHTLRDLTPISPISAGAWVGGAVFSHWLLDFVVHRPDLPLYDNSMKVGLGLWNYPAVALSLEAALLFGGMILYLRTTEPINAIGRFGPPAFGVVMLAIQCYVFFGPPPVSPAAAALTALAVYVVFAAIAEWLARQRRHAAA
jgi:hypothetical protein